SIVKHFQSVISKEAKQQILEKEGKLPAAVIACVGGGSNAIGAFTHFIDDEDVKLIGVEPTEAPTLTQVVPAVLHGLKCLTLLDDRKSTRLNSSHVSISYAVFCLKKKKYGRAH